MNIFLNSIRRGLYYVTFQTISFLNILLNINWRIINNNNHLVINHLKKKKKHSAFLNSLYSFIFHLCTKKFLQIDTKDTNDPRILPIGQFTCAFFQRRLAGEVFRKSRNAIQQQRNSWLALNKCNTKPVFDS